MIRPSILSHPSRSRNPDSLLLPSLVLGFLFLLLPLTASGLELPASIDSARAVYLPERHDSDADHRFQLEVLKTMAAAGEPFAVGMEMFDVTQQPELDQWFRGEISTSELVRVTGFEKGWGKQSPWYRRILDWCRSNGIAVIALNAPRTITRAVARGETLPADAQRYLPDGFHRPAGGFAKFQSMFPGAAHGGDLGKFYRAQLTWDATMARRVAGFLEENPGWRLAVLAGRGHVGQDFGIPFFVEQRGDFRQAILKRAE